MNEDKRGQRHFPRPQSGPRPQGGPRPARPTPNIPPATRVPPDAAPDAFRTLPVRPGGANSGAPRVLPRRPEDREAFHTLPRRPVPPDLPENLLVGRNPIREALRAGVPIDKLLVANGDLSGAAQDIVRLAREMGVVVQMVDRARLDAIYPAHQGLLAWRAARTYATVADILQRAKQRAEAPMIVLLDGVTDPHNLGAIIRSAECTGAHGVVIPERRAAGLTPACEKAAAGALNHLPVARVGNLNRAIEELQAAGVWVVAAALDGEDALSCDLTGPIALVVGSEGEGISRLTLEKCDRRITLPMLGEIASLNASVAAGVLLYQIVRARRG